MKSNQPPCLDVPIASNSSIRSAPCRRWSRLRGKHPTSPPKTRTPSSGNSALIRATNDAVEKNDEESERVFVSQSEPKRTATPSIHRLLCQVLVCLSVRSYVRPSACQAGRKANNQAVRLEGWQETGHMSTGTGTGTAAATVSNQNRFRADPRGGSQRRNKSDFVRRCVTLRTPSPASGGPVARSNW